MLAFVVACFFGGGCGSSNPLLKAAQRYPNCTSVKVSHQQDPDSLQHKIYTAFRDSLIVTNYNQATREIEVLHSAGSSVRFTLYVGPSYVDTDPIDLRGSGPIRREAFGRLVKLVEGLPVSGEVSCADSGQWLLR